MALSPLPKQNEIIYGTELMKEEIARPYLENVTAMINTSSEMVAASQFSKRYARFVTEPAFKALTIEGRMLDLSPENSILHTDFSKDKWAPEFRMLKTDGLIGGNYQEKRAILTEQVFAGHLQPVWKLFSSITRLPMPILWENTAVRVFSLYEKKLRNSASLLEIQQVNEDLHYLVYEAPGALFGEKNNPFRLFHRKLQENKEGEWIRERKTCCFNYAVNNCGSYCAACPKKP
ncbi:IucA/IucC family C-terminal-domain containing protein [Marinococcus luteus]|uniref:IucA/IucC family C-terminal-domain containing protein n=1 Tax=Marinococcus luteus TaxID=1122204 RepID=UPI002ACCB13B|nr:IucA/IucC family C-terminal-domain containing protein [Marinococcus luteus]MDZ5781962.1 IucA/IucC family C-terminal-domain containing protein [Marinococcus luteus]